MANQHLDTPWTDERVEALKRLWAEGYSATEIADELGEVTRCGVLGKAHRLGLSRHKSAEFKPGPPRPRKPRQPIVRRPVFTEPPPSPPPLPTPDEPLKKPHMRRLQFMQLKTTHCKWPFGDPRGHPFYFCGADKDAELPYCPHHMRTAFVKPRGPR